MYRSPFHLSGRTLSITLIVAATVAVFALVARQAMSDDQDESTKQQQMEEEMKKKWDEATKMGPHHEHLKYFVGEWDAVSKWMMAPDAPPDVSKAASSCRLLFGGRFLEQSYKGEAMGQPFEGRSVMGYDTLKEKYVSTWIDNMSNSIYSESGSCDKDGKVYTMTGEAIDPMTHKLKKTKSVIKIISDDEHVFEMYAEDDNGKPFKQLEITYKRR